MATPSPSSVALRYARSTQQTDRLEVLLKAFEEEFAKVGSWYRRRTIKTDKDQLARKISIAAKAVISYMDLKFEDAAFGKRIKKRLRRWENFKKMLGKIADAKDWKSLEAVLEKLDTKSKDAGDKYWEYKKFALMVLKSLDTEFEAGIEVEGHHVEMFTTPMADWDAETVGKVKAVIRSADSLLTRAGLGKAFGGRIQAWPSKRIPPSGKGSHNTLASYNPKLDLLRLSAGGKFRSTVNTAIHELGHRWYFRVMGNRGRAAWTKFFGDNVATPDLSAVMAEWEKLAKQLKYGAWFGHAVGHLTKKFPDQKMWILLAADKAGIQEEFDPMTGSPKKKKANRPGLEQMKEKLAEIKLFMHPVTAYSGTNPEELFAETFAYIVTEGPRRIPPIVRDAFRRAVPQARVARVATRYLEARHLRRLYHGTSTVNLDAIRKQGLRGDPGRRTFEDEVDRPMAGHIYLTPDPGLALQYAGRSARKYGGESLVLVFNLRPNDPRFVADEDWLATVRGYQIESGMPWYATGATDLSMLWALALGEPDAYPSVLDIPYGSREHVKLLIDTHTALRYNRDLKSVLETLRNIVKNAEPSHFSAIADDMDEEELRSQADRLTGVVRKATEKMLHMYAPHPWVPADRILQFLLDPEMQSLASDPQKFSPGSLSRRDMWPALQEKLITAWPEWFGPEAALVSQRGGSNRTVAIKATNLMPDEAFEVDLPGGLNSYADLGRRGKAVL
jgi:hypothetical protein